MDFKSRKISGFLPSSSPPAASTHKRKASTLSDTEDLPPTNNHNALNSPSSVSSHNGYRSPVSPQQHKKRFTAMIKAREALRTSTLERSANKAIRKSRVGTPREQDMQEKLLQEQREEEERLLQEQREKEDAGRGLLKKQLPSPKTPSVGRREMTQMIWDIVKAPKILWAGQRPSTRQPLEILKAPKTYPAAESSASLVPHPPPSTTKPKTIRPTLTSATTWSKQPNSHARALLAAHGNNTKAFLRSLQEPLYAVRDAEIRDALREMTCQIRDFAEQHFSFQVTDEAQLRSVLPILPKETVKIIGLVASGGPKGVKGWEELFLDSQKRQALVSAIVGNVLVEQVLQHLFFGGSKMQVEQVELVQFRLRNEDGFDRTTTYANKIRTSLCSPPPTEVNEPSQPQPQPSSLHLPRYFNTHITHITASLLTHLSPLLSLSPAPFSSNDALIPALHALVTHTALLSLCMRLDASTAYCFVPVFKETLFVRNEMDCSNETEMIYTHPRNGKEDHLLAAEIERRAAMSNRERKQMRNDRAIVHIAILPGCMAYRRGGWEDTPSSKADVSKGGAKGIRIRQLTKSFVSCRWGVERRWKDKKPADEPTIHGSRWGGGFVEFFPGVEGVVDPKGREGRKEKGKGKTREEAGKE